MKEKKDQRHSIELSVLKKKKKKTKKELDLIFMFEKIS